jgi:hypothetical protein
MPAGICNPRQPGSRATGYNGFFASDRIEGSVFVRYTKVKTV